MDEIDFDFLDHGSVWLIVPLTDAAQEHADEVFGEDALRLGGGIACEPRYVQDAMFGLFEEGYTVAVDGRVVEAMEAA